MAKAKRDPKAAGVVIDALKDYAATIPDIGEVASVDTTLAPELAVAYVPIDDVLPYARNSRTHSAEQIAAIAASIREFGFLNPVLVDAKGTLIAGHGRVLAARRLKLERVPTIRVEHLTEDQRRAYVLVDNQLATQAGWNPDVLKLELGALHMAEFDMGLLGFSPDDLAQHMGLELPPAEPPKEGADGQDDNYKSQFGVIVVCESETHQAEVYDQLVHEGFNCKVVVT